MMFAAGSQAADSLIDLEAPRYSFLPEYRLSEVTPTLWQRVDFSFHHRADDAFTDSFHPFRLIQRDGDGQIRLFDESIDHPAEMAQDSLSDAFSSSVRDAALSMNLPFVVWLKEREGFLSNFLWDSIDSVEEETVDPLDLTYRRSERSWWNDVSKRGKVRVGLRPFNTNPYAFLSWRLKDSERVRLLGHLRYRYKGFSDHSFELGLSMPMARGLSLDFGTSYRIGRREDQQSLVFRLTKSFARDAVAYIGVEAQQQPVLIAGISIPL